MAIAVSHNQMAKTLNQNQLNQLLPFPGSSGSYHCLSPSPFPMPCLAEALCFFDGANLLDLPFRHDLENLDLNNKSGPIWI